jgi:hypothetical protein
VVVELAPVAVAAKFPKLCCDKSISKVSVFSLGNHPKGAETYFFPLNRQMLCWDRCYDFRNIFAQKLAKMAVFVQITVRFFKIGF